MKGRKYIQRSIVLGPVIAGDIIEGLYKSKLLSAKGCDTVTQVEDERDTRYSLSHAEVAFYKSLPEWNEEHYDL